MVLSKHVIHLYESGVRKIRLSRVNTPGRTHLYYLIDHGIAGKELYSGLAHVTEHACLAEEGRFQTDHFRWGCTCLSHMILYYETRHDFQWINEIKQQMRNNTIISSQKVDIAKTEVIEESRLLKAKTQLREGLVRFVTEDRITDFAMGIPSEIEKIQYQDVLDYWEYLNCRHHIYEIPFRDRQDVESVFQEILESYPLKENDTVHKFVRNKTCDEYLVLSQSDQCTLKIYFQIPPLAGKEDYVAKAFIECYLQKLFSKHLQIDVSIEEKFFSKSEKFVLMTVHGVPEEKVKLMISNMRTCIAEKSSFDDMRSLYSGFIDDVIRAIAQEKAVDSINKYQNWLLFQKPFFSAEDVAAISSFNSDMSAAVKYILNEGVKVVVTSSVS